jgi:hypothetical protein
MSNNITIELCAEDRARLDRLAEALERKACDKFAATAMEFAKLHIEPQPESDPVQKALAETLAKAEAAVEPQKNATEEAESSTPTTTPLEEEITADEEPAQPEPTKTVTHAELKAKVIELSAKDLKLKAQAREIVLSYAPTVGGVPEDKLNECYKKIVALEG